VYNIVVWNLLQPYPILILALGLILLSLWRKRRASRPRLFLLTMLFVVLVALSTPAVAYVGIGSLEWQHEPLEQRPPDAEAIVVLASALRAAHELRPHDKLDEDSLRRCLYAADLYKQGKPCTIIVCGGKEHSESPGCSVVMRDFLIELGVKPEHLLTDSSSETTHENAVECRRLLDEKRLRKILLVTDAVDMPRALGCFRKQGIDATPAACHFQATRFSGTWLHYVPNLRSALKCQRVCHEWLGIAWYWLNDRI
jgi:uncharacterized SAM-binding protein YcdF (DUF218 family)